MADWNNLKFRIISAVVGIPLIVLFIYLGKLYLLGFALVIIYAAFFEYLKMQKMDSYLNLSTGLISVLIFGYAFYKLDFVLTLLFIVIFPVFMAAEGIGKAFKVICGIYYISLLYFLVLLRDMPLGFEISISVVAMTWAFDIFSYFGGTLFGKHKLAPSLSPGKSYEGLLSGILIVTAASLGLYFIPVVLRVVLGISIALASLAGDLIESKIKRLSEVKDSGSIIPGHGGIFDRFDSLILSAPVGYFLVLIFMKLGY